jgi:hypothetical protein
LFQESSASTASASTTGTLAFTLSRLSVASTDILINSPPLGHTENPQKRTRSKLAAVDEEMSATVNMHDDSNQPSDEDRSPSPTPVWLNCGLSHLPASPIDFDPYCPLNYTCTGYQDGYVWFDGKQGSKDMEFIIDLEGGSMDK